MQHKTKLFFLILIIIITNACSPKVTPIIYNTKTYTRTVNGKSETFKIDFSRKLFTYTAKANGQNYMVNGNMSTNRSQLIFEFPANSEYDSLSVFPKEYSELVFLDSSDLFEIDLSIINLESRTKSNRWEIAVSPRKAKTNLELSDDSYNLKVDTPNSSVNLIIKRRLLRDDTIIKIPKKGKYKLEVYLLPPKTVLMSESTTEGCFDIVFKPKVSMYVCKKSDSGIIGFGFKGDCKNSYIVQE